MRTVVDTSEVPHLWAHKTQGHARNRQGNFYFDGDIIYSYGTHFPIASHVTNKKGKPAILVTTRTYSNTTAGHICEVNYAIPDTANVFHVWDVPCYKSSQIDHDANFKANVEKISDLAEMVKKARSRRDEYLAMISNTVAEINRYADFFGLGKKYRLDPSKDVAALIAEFQERAAKIRKAQAKEAKRQEKLRKEAEAKRLIELAGKIEDWKAGLIDHLPHTDKIFLRIEKDVECDEAVDAVPGDAVFVVATSRGARFPLAHGIRAFKLIAACRNGQKPWERNGHTIHLGHYAIDRIEANGDVKAGCHRIEWAEIERIAKAVGVTE